MLKVERKIDLVYGGGSVGLMGLISQAVHDGGRHVLGIIPKSLAPREITGESIGEVITVSTMHQRKAEMGRQADAFIALPGGYGTFEELLEVTAPVPSNLHPSQFYGVKSKEIYRVADQSLTVSFSNGSVLAPLDDIPTSVSFPTDRFRFHTYEDFKANGGLRGDLYDVVGHLRLVNGQSLIDRPVLDKAEVISTRHILVHLQLRDGPVMKLYLWDQAAKDFTRSSHPPFMKQFTNVCFNVLTKIGNLSLSSMASSRVFIDKDIQPTIDYFSWLNSNPEIAKRVNADEVTMAETMTIGQIFAYIKQKNAKLSQERFLSTTMTDQAVLSYLVMQEANQELGAGHQMPPQALIDTIGRHIKNPHNAEDGVVLPSRIVAGGSESKLMMGMEVPQRGCNTQG
ncbi:hypothetical protein Bca52824_028903 [Brassica carinata]|uniref:cytokinin riboside 5'-monophosphate phosphoribohydrolase n=1 Tax=Brassica carinata TaxID=52824 RepID=A0A8X7VD11_BRACI|nr:hypothetical protein Bca52824_028903 [Brassica carinata]